MTTSGIEVVSFDLDNTLCRYERPPEAVLSDAFDDAGVDPLFTVEAYVETFDELAGDAPDMPTLRRRAFERLAEAEGADRTVGRTVADAYTASRDPAGVRWRDGMETVFERFRDRYDIVVVTNGLPGAQTAKLERLGILDRLDALVCCDGTVPRKPALEPFERALRAIDSRPDRAVHIGDSPAHDVAGANRACLTSVWFPDAEWVGSVATEPARVEADFRITRATELHDPPWESEPVSPGRTR